MLPLDIRKYLYDIQQACELLSEFTAGKTLDDYTTNAMLQSAVERQFEIIGEALNQMLRRDPALTPLVAWLTSKSSKASLPPFTLVHSN